VTQFARESGASLQHQSDVNLAVAQAVWAVANRTGGDGTPSRSSIRVAANASEGRLEVVVSAPARTNQAASTHASRDALSLGLLRHTTTSLQVTEADQLLITMMFALHD